MVLVYLNTGECIEVREAVDAGVVHPYLVCRNSRGEEVARFHLRVIQSFTRNERLIQVSGRKFATKTQAGPRATLPTLPRSPLTGLALRPVYRPWSPNVWSSDAGRTTQDARSFS